MSGEPTPVLYVAPSGERGGAEAVLLTILRALDRGRFRPRAVVLGDGPFVRELRERGSVQVDVIPAGRSSDLPAAVRVGRALRRVIDGQGIRLVHAMGTQAHCRAALAARRARVPCVHHVHDVPEWSWTRQGALERAAALLPAAATVAVSRHVADALGRWGPPRAVTVIHNAVPAPAVPSAPADWPAPPGALRVLWCGRLQRWKGAHLFLEAAARAAAAVPAARFAVVGGARHGIEPDGEVQLARRARALGLGDVVRLTGWQDDPAPFFAAADVVVHCSIRPEPFGLVVLEAMAHGKPVIAPAAGGPAEIVEPGVSGVLVPPGDAGALAAALAALLGDPARRAALGRAGRARALGAFGVPAMVARLEALYGGLTGAPASRPALEARWTR